MTICKRALSGLALLALLGAAACKDEAPKPAPEAPAAAPAPNEAPKAPAEEPPKDAPAAQDAAPQAAEADVKLADELKAQIKDAQLPYKERSKKENARAFLYLAQSHDGEVAAAALQGMNLSWTYSERNDKKELVTPEYQAVVKKHLNAEDPAVLGRAIEAAPNAIAGANPDKDIIARLAELALDHPQGAARYEAVDALSRAKDFQKNGTVTVALLKALDDKEPYVISTALFRLQFAAYSLKDKQQFFTKARALLKHQDPGVRGRAALFTANAAPDTDKEALGAELHELLSDKDPFVRSAAASALARLKRLASIHKMVELLDDTTKNTYDIRDFKKLTGENGWVHHDGSAWSRVDDAILYALKTITWDMKDDKFEYRKVNYKTKDDDIAAAVKDAKAWYKKNKGKLPKA